MRLFAASLLTIALVACTPGGERDVDRSSVGPTATAGAVSIMYPPAGNALDLTVDQLISGWSETLEAELGAPPAVLVDGRIEAGAGNAPISLEAVVADEAVSVVQLALIAGSGDDDELRSSAAVLAFLGLILPEGSDANAVDTAFGELGFGENGTLFGLAETEYAFGGTTVYRASNEDTILLGVVASP